LAEGAQIRLRKLATGPMIGHEDVLLVGEAYVTKHEPKDRQKTRRPWQKPALARMKAGAAEVGTNPIVGDGPFSVS
jgi:hypothetical protein